MASASKATGGIESLQDLATTGNSFSLYPFVVTNRDGEKLTLISATDRSVVENSPNITLRMCEETNKLEVVSKTEAKMLFWAQGFRTLGEQTIVMWPKNFKQMGKIVTDVQDDRIATITDNTQPDASINVVSDNPDSTSVNVFKDNKLIAEISRIDLGPSVVLKNVAVDTLTEAALLIACAIKLAKLRFEIFGVPIPLGYVSQDTHTSRPERENEDRIRHILATMRKTHLKIGNWSLDAGKTMYGLNTDGKIFFKIRRRSNQQSNDYVVELIDVYGNVMYTAEESDEGHLIVRNHINIIVGKLKIDLQGNQNFFERMDVLESPTSEFRNSFNRPVMRGTHSYKSTVHHPPAFDAKACEMKVISFESVNDHIAETTFDRETMLIEFPPDPSLNRDWKVLVIFQTFQLFSKYLNRMHEEHGPIVIPDIYF